MINLGKFTNTSGSMLLSDPCYKKGTWCSTEIDVHPGEWEGFVIKRDVEHWGNRCCELIAIKTGYDLKKTWKGLGADLGVDSGQLGIFDSAFYEDDFKPSDIDKQVPNKLEGWTPDSEFYGICANLTLSEAGAGVLSTGVVSSSGYGDGGYTGYVQEHEGLVAAIKVIFIREEDDNEL